MEEFSHLDQNGNAKMVDVSNKDIQKRTARASGKIFLSKKTIEAVKEQEIKKGDVLTVAKIAAIQAAKKTSDLIPLCHALKLNFIDLTLEIETDGIFVISEIICIEKTGAEMEALTAVSVSLLTIYDMCKAIDKTMRIGEIQLVHKEKENV